MVLSPLRRLTHVQFTGLANEIHYSSTNRRDIYSFVIKGDDGKIYVTAVWGENNPNLEKGDYVLVQYRRGFRTRIHEPLLEMFGLLSTIENPEYKANVVMIWPEPKIKKLASGDRERSRNERLKWPSALGKVYGGA